jgi:DNA-binding MarR family transcriptional regulator
MDIRNFGFLLRDVARLYIKHFERHTGEIGLTLGQAKVLGYLARTEGSTQAALAELSETDPMTLVRILDRMEADGLIERRSDPEDRRVRRLYLRKAAKPVMDSIDKLAAEARVLALSGLSSTDQERLMRLIDHVHRNLSTEPAAVGSPAAKPAEIRRPAAGIRRGRR